MKYKIRQVNTDQKRFFKKVQNRLDKGWTWKAIANDLGMNLNTVYSKYHYLKTRDGIAV